MAINAGNLVELRAKERLAKAEIARLRIVGRGSEKSAFHFYVVTLPIVLDELERLLAQVDRQHKAVTQHIYTSMRTVMRELSDLEISQAESVRMQHALWRIVERTKVLDPVIAGIARDALASRSDPQESTAPEASGPTAPTRRKRSPKPASKETGPRARLKSKPLPKARGSR